MAKKRPTKRRTHSRLSQHRPAADSKKILKPPLRQLPMTDARWLEDLLPEYPWAAGFVAGDADAGPFRLARVLDAMTADTCLLRSSAEAPGI